MTIGEIAENGENTTFLPFLLIAKFIYKNLWFYIDFVNSLVYNLI